MKIKYDIFQKKFKRNDLGVVEKFLVRLGEVLVNEKGGVLYVSPSLLNYETENPPLREILRRWGNGAYYEYHSSVITD